MTQKLTDSLKQQIKLQFIEGYIDEQNKTIQKLFGMDRACKKHVFCELAVRNKIVPAEI